MLAKLLTFSLGFFIFIFFSTYKHEVLGSSESPSSSNASSASYTSSTNSTSSMSSTSSISFTSYTSSITSDNPSYSVSSSSVLGEIKGTEKKALVASTAELLAEEDSEISSSSPLNKPTVLKLNIPDHPDYVKLDFTSMSEKFSDKSDLKALAKKYGFPLIVYGSEEIKLNSWYSHSVVGSIYKENNEGDRLPLPLKAHRHIVASFWVRLNGIAETIAQSGKEKKEGEKNLEDAQALAKAYDYYDAQIISGSEKMSKLKNELKDLGIRERKLSQQVGDKERLLFELKDVAQRYPNDTSLWSEDLYVHNSQEYYCKSQEYKDEYIFPIIGCTCHGSLPYYVTYRDSCRLARDTKDVLHVGIVTGGKIYDCVNECCYRCERVRYHLLGGNSKEKLNSEKKNFDNLKSELKKITSEKVHIQELIIQENKQLESYKLAKYDPIKYKTIVPVTEEKTPHTDVSNGNQAVVGMKQLLMKKNYLFDNKLLNSVIRIPLQVEVASILIDREIPFINNKSDFPLLEISYIKTPLHLELVKLLIKYRKLYYADYLVYIGSLNSMTQYDILEFLLANNIKFSLSDLSFIKSTVHFSVIKMLVKKFKTAFTYLSFLDLKTISQLGADKTHLDMFDNRLQYMVNPLDYIEEIKKINNTLL